MFIVFVSFTGQVVPQVQTMRVGVGSVVNSAPVRVRVRVISRVGGCIFCILKDNVIGFILFENGSALGSLKSRWIN